MKPNLTCYNPTFQPWLEENEEFARYVKATANRTLISPDRLWNLYTLAKQAVYIPGCWYECGVYKGGSAAMLARIMLDFAPVKSLYLFDTFEGMPKTDPSVDDHVEGDFADTSLKAVMSLLKKIASEARTICIAGTVPESFARRCKPARKSEVVISFAHVDMDIYESVKACTRHIYPRLSPGGIIVYDDYGFKQCYGARKAVDEYFDDKPETPIILQTGQAIVFRLAF